MIICHQTSLYCQTKELSNQRFGHFDTNMEIIGVYLIYTYVINQYAINKLLSRAGMPKSK
ncbi:hypothetical protein E9M_07404 [Moraxella catarrhalis 46P47B1]|nr:hypothetical protein E9M_07404 [Moraxella catarrhalis 46P47B1]